MIFGIEDLSFKPEQADSILNHCKKAGMDDMEIWLHCLSVAAGTCPNKDMTLAAVQMIYHTENISKDTEETIQ